MTTTRFKTESPLISDEQTLCRVFRQGEKPPEKWRIGTEHELMGFFSQDGRPVPYAGENGIVTLLEAFGQLGWERMEENGHLIALLKDGASITLEPGGQLELSGAPLNSVFETCAEIKGYQQVLTTLSKTQGLDWLAVGRNPFFQSDSMPWMPKERYGIMRNYLPGQGSMAIDMMVGTATVQTNVDYASEADMARKMRIATALAPVLTALFANSPFAEGRPSGYLSTRSLVWFHTDPDRSGLVPGVLSGDFGYRDYLHYALQVPMFFIHRDDAFVNLAGVPFEDFAKQGYQGHQANEQDWEVHLTTLFPIVRLKSYIELRMADVGPREMICALSAISRGLLYDDAAAGEALALVQGVTDEAYVAGQQEAAQFGLKGNLLGKPLLEWAKEVLAIAEKGLKRLNVTNSEGQNEAVFLEPLQQIVAEEATLADRMLTLWEGEWNGDLSRLREGSAWQLK